MKIIFMGTPEFSVGSLAALREAGHEICAVFTQPDKPKNRGKKIETSPVKDYALEHGIPVYQPFSLRKGEDAEASMKVMREINPDAIVVVAYGQLLPKAVLDLPKYGCINVHASLLPKYRGAAPIQRCIENGDTVSGVCTMKMDEGLDTGDVIMRREVEIPEEMTGTELAAALSAAGAELIAETAAALENSTAVFTKQEGETVYAEKITKEELLIDFGKPAADIHNKIRAMADAPCCYTFLEGKRLKIYRSAVTGRLSKLPAGSISDSSSFGVVCGNGECIELLEVQPEGGKRMKTADFLRGRKITPGEKLG